MSCVIDASALLAYLRKETGGEQVRDILQNGGVFMSSVNYAEVLAKFSDVGESPEDVHRKLTNNGFLGNVIELEPVGTIEALDNAKLRAKTKSLGLSFGDRSCLALGKKKQLPVVTADRAWKKINIGIKVQVVR